LNIEIHFSKESKMTDVRGSAESEDKNEQPVETLPVPKDSEIERDRESRKRQGLLIIGAGFAIPVALMIMLFGINLNTVLIGLIIGIFFQTAIFTHVLALVGQQEGVVALDLIRSNNPQEFGPGVHWKYITEIITAKDRFPLEIQVVVREQDYPTKSDKMDLVYKFFFRPKIQELRKLRGLTKSQVEDALNGPISELIAYDLMKMTPEQVGMASAYLGLRVANLFGMKIPDTRDKDTAELEKKIGPIKDVDSSLKDKAKRKLDEIGVEFLLWVLSDRDFSEEVRKARSQEASLLAFERSVAKQLGYATGTTTNLNKYRKDLREGKIPREDLGRAYNIALAAAGKIQRVAFSFDQGASPQDTDELLKRAAFSVMAQQPVKKAEPGKGEKDEQQEK
jgi:hypothetical protein